ncbi:glycine/D-amino acid oxidase-like deaminating enzyme [Flavobacteriaceae bacterium MAR_2009_75]|nr:glycine/D-amino acid oxidase-like deaminating enzyme [Flavobacteriaceae bacterium MAR_2009_75]
MNLSYWEYKTWLSNVDFTIVGSGIVGLSCALRLHERFPKAKILILEKGFLPQGASTKNAGFACFGSISEIIDDLRSHSEEQVQQLVKMRWYGIQLLRKTLADSNIDYQRWGGHEIFLDKDDLLYNECLEKLESVNKLLYPIFKANPFFEKKNIFNFNKVKDYYISHKFEGQIDTGKMMQALLRQVQKNKVILLNSVEVEEFAENGTNITVKTNLFEFKTKKLIVATNGFAEKLLNESIKPARAQVLLTKPIENLKVAGTFHFERGYYYFRNIDNRILIGGGRNLDFKAEETTEFGLSDLVQNRLEGLLRDIILPNIPFEIESRWSGIMGTGQEKQPIVKQLSNNVYCGVRLGGMGIAIGSLVGKEVADLV